DAAFLRSADGNAAYLLRWAGREVDVHGAILRPAAVQQLTYQLGTILPGGFPVYRAVGAEGLAQGNRGDAQQGPGQGTADGAGVGDRIADVGAPVDAGQDQLRFQLQQLGNAQQDAIAGCAADTEATFLKLVHPQRMVDRDGHRHAALVEVRGYDPHLVGNLVGDILQHLEARPAPAIIIGKQY